MYFPAPIAADVPPSVTWNQYLLASLFSAAVVLKEALLLAVAALVMETESSPSPVTEPSANAPVTAVVADVTFVT